MASKSSEGLHVVVIGAGMGGLATALTLAKNGVSHVDVYEVASNLGFVGAGIQLATNMVRILDRLDVWKDVEPEAVDVKTTSIREGSTNRELAHVDLSSVRETYKHPHMVGHRFSLATALYDACTREANIHFHFSHTIEILCFGPKPVVKVTPRGGLHFEVTSDVVVACDGVKSQTRDRMMHELDESTSVEDTGQASYRILLSREDMRSDPELLQLIDSETVTRWIGAKRHLIAYPVSQKQIYNISTIQPDSNFSQAPSATYTTKGSKKRMLEVFSDFCPVVRRMLDLVPEGEVCEWRLRLHAPLPTWVHHQVALVGDACHPTLPHLAQGAAQAIEDAAVLGVVLSLMPDSSPETVNKTLRVYEQLRKDRADTLVRLAAASGKQLHLADGDAKKERDKQFAALKERKNGQVPDKWADAEVQKMIYAHDCMQSARDKYHELFRALSSITVS